LNSYRKTSADADREPNPFAAGFNQFIGVAEPQAEACKLCRVPVDYFLKGVPHVFPSSQIPPDYKMVNSMRAGVEGMIEAFRQRIGRASGQGWQSRVSCHIRGDRCKGVRGDRHARAGDREVSEASSSSDVGRQIAMCPFGNVSGELAM
jgi:hypothetical protein